MVRTIAFASLITVALCHGAVAGVDTQPSRGGPTLELAAAPEAASRHGARRSRPPAAQTRPASSPGEPPGPGYCWYYIDRATRTPGFWDLCRER